jgi:hydrogenase expression/formation protein HypC
LHLVLAEAGSGLVDVEDVDGGVHRVSLLALEGPPPRAGEWLVVHSGYAIDRVDTAEAEAVRDELRGRPGSAGGSAP